jgi:acylaminoacyl-peptidase
MENSIDEDCRAWTECASAAVDLSNAHVSTTGLLTVQRSARDIDADRQRKYLYSIPIEHRTVLPPLEMHDSIQLRLPSPSGDIVAIFRTEEDKKNGSKDTKKDAVLEVWKEGGQALVRRMRLPGKQHGKVMMDSAGGFGMPAWNNAETCLVYAAERNPPETSSFFDDEPKKAKGGDDEEDGGSRRVYRGGKNTLNLGKSETWGEKYSEQSPLVDLWLVNVETGKLGRIRNVPGYDNSTTAGGYALGQPVFAPDGQSVVYTAWDAGGGPDMPKRLGLVFCLQRPCQLYQSSVSNLVERLASEEEDESKDEDVPFVHLTPDYRLAFSPRFSPVDDDGKGTLVCLSSKQGFDTHMGCFALTAMDWRSGRLLTDSLRTVVDAVQEPAAPDSATQTVAGLPFPGLFMTQLPNSCFLTSDCLLATSQWGSCRKVVRISLKEKNAVDWIRCIDNQSSDELLCVVPNRGGAVINSMLPNEPASIHRIEQDELLSAHFASSVTSSSAAVAKFAPIASTRFSPLLARSSALDFTMDIDLTNAPSVEGASSTHPIQSILLLPNKSKHHRPPLIVVPHGGPHSVSSTIYLPAVAFLCGHGGYAMLFVNYRGSIGFGQGPIDALSTRIGDLDVQDVVAATVKVKESGLVDPDRLGVCGGSHGGFLTGHLKSQYPDLFQAAAMRNPVVNIASMVTATDIPDWTYVEACGSYDWKQFRPPTADQLQTMWEKSPVRHVEAVKTPTLVALGLKDLRVPPSQGLEWFHTLRSMGVPTKLLTYEGDDHALAGVATEADHWINIKRWFDQYLKE